MTAALLDRDRLRLTFRSVQLEREFQAQFYKRHLRQNQIAAICGFLLYALFAIVDRGVGGDHWQTLILIRLGITQPLFAIIVGGFFVPGVAARYAHLLVFLAVLLAGISIIVMNILLPPAVQNLYLPGILVVLIFGLGFLRTDFRWPVAAGGGLFVIYLLLTYHFRPLPFPVLLASVFYFLSSLFIMAYTCWFLERKEREAFVLERQLRRLAHTDDLTGLANRRAFWHRFQEAWRSALRDGVSLTLVLVDLDRLKQINDACGHASGDAAIRQLAEALRSRAHEAEGLAARLGGDEFALLLQGGDRDRWQAAAASLARGFGSLSGSSGRQPLTASVGLVTVVPTPDLAPEDVLRQADEALYQAKRAGRACMRSLEPG